MIPLLYKVSRVGGVIETGSALEVSRAGRRESEQFPFGRGKHFRNSGDGCTTLWMNLMPLYTSKGLKW